LFVVVGGQGYTKDTAAIAQSATGNHPATSIPPSSNGEDCLADKSLSFIIGYNDAQND